MESAPVPRVLVVDDDPSYARLAELVLLEGLPAGSSVARALSLTEALDACATHPPSCVVLDLSLPDGGGLEAISRLREAGVGAPVVVLSGRSDASTAREAAARGADAYVVKGEEHDGRLAALVAATLR